MDLYTSAICLYIIVAETSYCRNCLQTFFGIVCFSVIFVYVWQILYLVPPGLVANEYVAALEFRKGLQLLSGCPTIFESIQQGVWLLPFALCKILTLAGSVHAN